MKYSAGSTGEPRWRDTRWDPLASRSGGLLGGIYWRAALAGYSAGSTGEPLGNCAGSTGSSWAGSTDEQLWRDTLRDALASSSGGILGGWRGRAALAEASQTRIAT